MIDSKTAKRSRRPARYSRVPAYLPLLLLGSIPALTARAQFESASVLGYTRDSSGAAIPNSKVILTNTATGVTQTGKSDSDGKYEFPSVPIGPYVVKVEAPSFESTQTQPFTVPPMHVSE